MTLKLTDKDKKMICEVEWGYTNDEMTDAYNNGEKGLLKSRMNYYTNATVFGKKFSVEEDMTDEEAEKTSTVNYDNGIMATSYIDAWTGYFYSLFKKSGKELLLRSDVFKIGKMNAYNTKNISEVREILVPLTKEVGEDESRWVLDTEMAETAIKGDWAL